MHHRITKWKPKPRPNIMRGRALNPPMMAEARYYARLQDLIMAMAHETAKELNRLYRKPVAEEYFAEDASISAQAKMVLAALIDKFQPIFDLAAKPLAEHVTAEASKASAVALKGSLAELSGGLKIKTDFISGDIAEILKSTISENVSLIKSIPQQFFTQIQGEVFRSITMGKGEADLVPYLEKQTGVTLRRAKIISRDQTRKAFSNLNAARMKQVGIQEYEWLHSNGGQHPRPLHSRHFTKGGLNGSICRLDAPPIIDEKTGQRGKPGDLINCRCSMIPVIKFNEGNQNDSAR